MKKTHNRHRKYGEGIPSWWLHLQDASEGRPPPWWDEAEAALQQRAATDYVCRLAESDLTDIRVRHEIARLAALLFSGASEGTQKGDEAAISLLLDHARVAVNKLNAAAFRNKNAFRRVAEARSLWPVVVTPHADDFAAARDLIGEIRLGSKTGVGYRNSKRFQLKDERAIVAGLYLQLLAHRNFLELSGGSPADPWHKLASNLPLLSRDKAVIKAWWKPILLLFNERYGVAFETDSDFVRHWMSPRYGPPGKRGDPEREGKQSAAARIYWRLTDWWLRCVPRSGRPRVSWPGHDVAVQAQSYPEAPEGSWQYLAMRLPALTRRDSIINQWFEAARLLNRDDIFGYSHLFSVTEFPAYMMNALKRRNEIRKNIKDLLEQAVGTIASEGCNQEVLGK